MIARFSNEGFVCHVQLVGSRLCEPGGSTNHSEAPLQTRQQEGANCGCDATAGVTVQGSAARGPPHMARGPSSGTTSSTRWFCGEAWHATAAGATADALAVRHT